jgi:tetratricopeptide (TPR) repeat protein
MCRGAVALVCLLALSGPSLAGRGGGDISPGQAALDDGILSVSRGDLTRALTKFDQAMELDARLRDIACPKMGAVLYSMKRYADAVKLLRGCPDIPEVREQLGMNLMKAGSEAEGLRLLESVVKEAPNPYAAWLTLGLYYQTRDLKKSIAAFEAYFKQAPATGLEPQLHTRLGYLYMQDGKWQPAIKHLLLGDPKDLNTRIALATAYVGGEEYEQGRVMFERMLDKAPQFPAIYYNLASAYAHTGRKADAAKMLGEYKKLKPGDPKIQKLEDELAKP